MSCSQFKFLVSVYVALCEQVVCVLCAPGGPCARGKVEEKDLGAVEHQLGHDCETVELNW